MTSKKHENFIFVGKNLVSEKNASDLNFQNQLEYVLSLNPLKTTSDLENDHATRKMQIITGRHTEKSWK